MMDELPKFLTGNPGGFLGFISAGIFVILWLFRKFQLGDKIDSASARAQVDIIQRLGETADRAEKRAADAEARADIAYRERNEAYQKIGELTEQVRHLQQQVDALQRTLDAIPPK